jgi:hypothetical protein
MDMHVEVERPSEPLHDRDRATATVRHAVPACAGAQGAEHRAEERGDHRAAQIVVPRQPIAHAIRQAEDPLPYGHVGEHAIHQVRGALAHPTATATRTEPASLARERDQPIEAAGRAAEPRKPAGKPAAPEKIPKLLLDEPRQPFSVAQTRGPRAKGLEGIAVPAETDPRRDA